MRRTILFGPLLFFACLVGPGVCAAQTGQPKTEETPATSGEDTRPSKEAPPCCGQGPSTEKTKQAQGGKKETETTTDDVYVCPLAYMGPSGDGLHMYYAGEWKEDGCGDNPQPLYLDQPDLQGCPDDPTTGNCVNTGPEANAKRKLRTVRDKGCEKGHKIKDFPPQIAKAPVTQSIVGEFTGTYTYEDAQGNERTLLIRFYRIKFKFNDNFWIANVGFEDPNGAGFPPRDMGEISSPMGKCFIATVDDFGEDMEFRVLLHRKSDELN